MCGFGEFRTYYALDVSKKKEVATVRKIVIGRKKKERRKKVRIDAYFLEKKN